MFIFLIRTAILYALVVLIIRLMGKRQIGELEPFELVVTIMISDLASLPMQDNRLPLINGVIPIVTLLIIQVVLSEVQIRSKKFKNILDGTPCVLIKNGIIDTNQLRNQRLSLPELMEELRIKGHTDLTEIAFAIWETNGQLSIIEKNIDQTPVYIPRILFNNGKLYGDILQAINKDEDWFNNELIKNKVTREEIDFAIINCKGKFSFQRKAGSKK